MLVANQCETNSHGLWCTDLGNIAHRFIHCCPIVKTLLRLCNGYNTAVSEEASHVCVS